MSRAITRCQACRYHVLDSFAALAGVSLRSSPQFRSAQVSNHQSRSLFRAYTSSKSRFSENQRDIEVAEQKSPSKQDASIPWYLQVETPTPPAPISPLHALQDIPPIPSDAPEILSPILSHLSVHIGLDNLSLIDLRHLDPPPALGANLIMILGTARSYKHLNTSADRFCRWLRSRYKLQPYADGLLGRNELKLKLRRKARKMKLAQSVGNTVALGEADDGITTGWVCVNMGTVENARIPEDEKQRIEAEKAQITPTRQQQEELDNEEEEYENPADDNYIGFGSRSAAPRIVVQMFTEDKRLEMDLEGLWDVRMERKARKSERADAHATRQAEDSSSRDRLEQKFRPFGG